MPGILHYDCFAGISGDMNLSAMIDLGVPLEYLKEELGKLGLHGYEIIARKASKSGICGTYVEVKENDHGHNHNHGHDASHDSAHTHHEEHIHEHRSLADIQSLIEKSSLSGKVKECSSRIFLTLAEAEAKVHGKPVKEVHFHEVGAVDSIVDIVGAVICLEYLNVDKITSSVVELGGGTVRCAHGVMPVPAPATALLAKNFPSSIGGTDHEATTPTGAAYLSTVVSSFSPKLAGRCIGTGIGIGHRDSDKLPNILRVMLYETEEMEFFSEGTSGRHVELVTNIDDMTSENLSYLMDKLFDSGADDVWTEAIYMKKNRLGTKVSALVSIDRTAAVKETFFLHSTTLGIREIPMIKHTLPRTLEEKITSKGPVRVKKAILSDGRTREKYEFEDCRRIAEKEGCPIAEVVTIISHEGKDEKA